MRNANIRRLLFEGPATSGEVSASLGISKRSARVGLWVLRKAGHALVSGEIPGKGVPQKIYALTARGLCLAQRERGVRPFTIAPRRPPRPKMSHARARRKR